MMLQAAPSNYKLSESALRRVAERSGNNQPEPERERSSFSSGSTPHAPRVKKPAALLTSTDKKQAYHDTLGVSKKLPESPQLKLEAPQQAWDSQTILVQPFRSTKCKPPPNCVPALDLSRFNEPDSHMEPVKVLATERPQLSSTALSEQSSHDLQVEDVDESSSGEATPTGAETTPPGDLDTSLLEPSQAKFVESKLLSNERGHPQPQLNAGVFPRHPATLQRSVMVPEVSLSKKLRFEARALTQNGRDVHRELCGFFFLSDGSLTVYEFRQFGKRSSALPVIQRGVYQHLFGPRRGDPYEINLIRKGGTLHFRSSEHPGLPNTLASRSLLTLMITYVDEAAKKQLLTEGRNPMECRAVHDYLNEPDSVELTEDERLYRTLQGMVVSRLQGRASKTLVGLGRQLVGIGDTVTKQQLQQCLRSYHISLTVEDMNQLWVLMISERSDVNQSAGSSGHHSNASSLHGNERVCVDGCISRLVGAMSEDRIAPVRKLFRKLDHQKTGLVDIEQLQRFFNASRHPRVISGQRSSEEVWFSLFDCLQSGGSAVSYSDFEHYYQGVSIETAKDSDYYSILKNCWSI